MGKGYVKEIIELFPDVNFEYHHNQSPKLVKDLKIPYSNIRNDLYSVNEPWRITNQNLYLNTWFYYIVNGNGTNNLNYVRKGQWWDLNKKMRLFYDIISDFLEIPLIEIKSPYDYIPDIDYDCFDLPKSFETEYKNTIVFSNGPVHSHQSSFENNDAIIFALLDEFPEKTIILTHKTNIINDNVIYTEDIINTDNGDINEISYIGYKKAKYILGRHSGPFQFMNTKRILNSPEKVIVGFGYKLEETLTQNMSFPSFTKNLLDFSLKTLIKEIIECFKQSESC
jgi:hypothetical protein